MVSRTIQVFVLINKAKKSYVADAGGKLYEQLFVVCRGDDTGELVVAV